MPSRKSLTLLDQESSMTYMNSLRVCLTSSMMNLIEQLLLKVEMMLEWILKRMMKSLNLLMRRKKRRRKKKMMMMMKMKKKRRK